MKEFKSANLVYTIKIVLRKTLVYYFTTHIWKFPADIHESVTQEKHAHTQDGDGSSSEYPFG